MSIFDVILTLIAGIACLLATLVGFQVSFAFNNKPSAELWIFVCTGVLGVWLLHIAFGHIHFIS